MRAANSGFVISKEMFADPNLVKCEVFESFGETLSEPPTKANDSKQLFFSLQGQSRSFSKLTTTMSSLTLHSYSTGATATTAKDTIGSDQVLGTKANTFVVDSLMDVQAHGQNNGSLAVEAWYGLDPKEFAQRPVSSLFAHVSFAK
jgi:hypothetical protein